jgi:hypothetical protein
VFEDLLQDKADLGLQGVDLAHLQDVALLHGLGQDAFDEDGLLAAADRPVADEVGDGGLAVERDAADRASDHGGDLADEGALARAAGAVEEDPLVVFDGLGYVAGAARTHSDNASSPREAAVPVGQPNPPAGGRTQPARRQEVPHTTHSSESSMG